MIVFLDVYRKFENLDSANLKLQLLCNFQLKTDAIKTSKIKGFWRKKSVIK